MMEITAGEVVKFYRPDLKFSSIRDWPCSEEDHEDCDGIGAPFKCPCTCPEMSDLEIEAMQSGERKKVKAA